MTVETTTFYIFLGILVVSLVIFIYIIRNLLLKTEKYEDISQSQSDFINSLSAQVGEMNARLQELDSKGAFASDDETGYFFDNLKSMITDIQAYQVPENYGQKKKQT